MRGTSGSVGNNAGDAQSLLLAAGERQAVEASGSSAYQDGFGPHEGDGGEGSAAVEFIF